MLIKIWIKILKLERNDWSLYWHQTYRKFQIFREKVKRLNQKASQNAIISWKNYGMWDWISEISLGMWKKDSKQ